MVSIIRCACYDTISISRLSDYDIMHCDLGMDSGVPCHGYPSLSLGSVLMCIDTNLQW